MTLNDLLQFTDQPTIRAVTFLFILMAAGITLAFFLTLLTLIFHRLYHSFYEKKYKSLSHWIIQYLLDTSLPEPDADILSRHILKNAIQDLLLVTRGYERGILHKLYVSKKFWDEDKDNLKSLYWHRRLEAMVRLDQWQIALGMQDLETVINDENKHIRQIVLKNLSRTKDSSEACYLLENLNPQLTFRSVLVEILSRLTKNHKNQILQSLKNEYYPELTPYLIKAIGDNRVIEAVPVLLNFSNAVDQEIKELTMIALGMIGDPRGISAIQKGLFSSNNRIKIAAMRSMFNVDQDELMKHKEILFNDPDPVVRNWMVHFMNGGK